MTSDEQALVELERSRLRALVDADLATAEPIHAADFELVTPAGMTLSKPEYLDAIASRRIDYLIWDPDQDIKVRVRGDAGCLRYGSSINMRFEGAETGLDRYWHTDYYERRGGNWQIVWSHATAALPTA